MCPHTTIPHTQVGNGDTVEILTSATQTPSTDWLGIARTSKAQVFFFYKRKEKKKQKIVGGKSLNFKKQLRQARIRAWIKAQQREKSVLLGRQV